MNWLQRHRARHYLQNSMWIWPAISVFLAMGLARLFDQFESPPSLESELTPDGARDVLGTLAASMFTFVVFVSSAMLVAVQLASSQLTPRVIAVVFRDPVTRVAMVLFVFTFTFTLSAMVRLTTTVPPLITYTAAYGCVASLAMFLYLIDHVGKVLRPSGALWAVAREGRRVIASVYPRAYAAKDSKSTEAPDLADAPEKRVVTSPRDGVILAFDIPGLVRLASRSDCIIELVPQVGDFVAVGDPLFRIFGGSLDPSEKQLGRTVAVGQERTTEQDPTFAFRMLVDIASKGLSPAINDPTTAVLALDQIHHLLRDVGRRRLDDERVRDRRGVVRLIYRTPDWSDFVHLAVTEIRQFGGASVQVARRLRAMLENLIQTLPAARVELLQNELELVRRSVERCFADVEDRALADLSDRQGVGGKTGAGEIGRKVPY